MLKIKDNEVSNLCYLLDGIEKTRFIYFEQSGIRVNKHNGIIEIGNFKYSPYGNIGKSRYNVPDILLEMCQMGLVEQAEDKDEN